MAKRKLYGLLLIAIVVLLAFLVRGSTNLDLLVMNVSMKNSIAYLVFTATGVVIGVLLR